MKRADVYRWFLAIASQFIEGACDSFLIVAGGNTVAQSTAGTLPAMTVRQIVLSVVLGGLIYAASYLKKNPLPTAAELPAALPPTQ